MGLTLVTAPTTYPVDLDTLADHLRVVRGPEDTLLQAYLAAATEVSQVFARRQFVTATYDQTFDEFADFLELKRPPLQSVTSVKYIDIDGAEQTLSSSVYDVDTSIEPGCIRLAWNQSWPSTRTTPNAVTVRFVAGYGTTAQVAPTAKAAVLLWTAQLYEHREPVVINEIARKVPLSVESLLWSLRVPDAA